jgi:1,4-dihydroxy-2-naphthoyl-CoA synthase
MSDARVTRASRATVDVRVDRAVAIVELRRPETFNAFNITLGRELLAVLEEIERDRSIGAVVLTGAGTSRPAPRCWSRDEAENPVLPEPRGPVSG